jgi:hypothetical protein
MKDIGCWAFILFEGLWEGFPHAGPVGRGIEACPGFHWLWKELPQKDIPDEGMDPCPEFQGPSICAPSAGIVPCASVDYPKMGVPPDGKATDVKVLLPNVSFQTNDDELTDRVCAGVP